LFREGVFEIPETEDVSRFREIAVLIPETTDDTGIFQKLSEVLMNKTFNKIITLLKLTTDGAILSKGNKVILR
jgi:hypothetical protein